MKLTPANLPSEPAELQSIIADLSVQLQQLTEENHSLKHQLALLKAKQFGRSSEKLERQIADVELRVEEQETTENVLAAVLCDDTSDSIDGKQEKQRPKREPLPADLPREEKLLAPAPACPDCGGEAFRKIADDISEVLEYVPATFKVIRYIRPRCACIACEKIVQAYVPSKTISKGKAGPGLLAHLCLQKYCYSLPFYRQSQQYGREGITLSRSTMANWAGQCARLLEPLAEAIRQEIFSSSHIHGDDTTIPVLSKGLGKTKTGRLWVYVKDERSYQAGSPSGACYFYSPDRKGERPKEHLAGFKGVFHADAYPGYDQLYADDTIKEAACWAHTRRKFHDVTVPNGNASIATETLKKMAEIYTIEDQINGKSVKERLSIREKESAPLVEALFEWWRKALPKLPKKSMTAKAIRYALNNEDALLRFLEDGKIQIDNNAAERAMRTVAIGRKNWLFAGSDKGGETAANLFTIIETAKLNNVNPHKYLTNVLAIIQDYNSQKIHELLPWNLNS